jgi:hypothetical protein
VGARFSPPVQTGPGAHLASCTMGTRFFLGVEKQPGCDADPSLPSSAEVYKHSRKSLSVRAFVACKKGETQHHFITIFTSTSWRLICTKMEKTFFHGKYRILPFVIPVHQLPEEISKSCRNNDITVSFNAIDFDSLQILIFLFLL